MQRQKFRLLNESREVAAKLIQKMWKQYKAVFMIPKAQKAKKKKMMKILSKYIRGYLIQKRILLELGSIKFKENLAYFDKIKNQLRTDSQILIRYWWFKYKKNLEKMKKIDLQKMKKINLKKTKKKTVHMNKAIYSQFAPSPKKGIVTSQHLKYIKSNSRSSSFQCDTPKNQPSAPVGLNIKNDGSFK
mmetsp:Transcript_4512/g.3787  ORF Transcript_4512/g.3787 Transcript_4512/m.3787 type:complete len:188 (+) Transcript_4512:720-1283(+)